MRFCPTGFRWGSFHPNRELTTQQSQMSVLDMAEKLGAEVRQEAIAWVSMHLREGLENHQNKDW